MPELPDIVVYIEALEQRILDQKLRRVDISAPFLLRTAVPPITTVEDRKVVRLRRLGKRICMGLEDDLWMVLHLMIAGRLHWRDRKTEKSGVVGGAARTGERHATREQPMKRSKRDLAVFDFSDGVLSLTEAGTQRRASLHVVKGEDNLQRFNPGGVEVFEIDVEQFAQVLRSANHTLKRALTDPRLFSGIGNAYSDEILFHARLSPIALTQKLTGEEVERLFESTCSTLTEWIDRLRAECRTGKGSERAVASSNVQRPMSNVESHNAQSATSSQQSAVSQREEGRFAPSHIRALGNFPEKVTAFRPEMAVHGKYQEACPRCGAKIQRIRYASNETNYCPNCQTGGRLLADRALSRLLRADWPRNTEELEGLTRER
ncbi:MAG: DNA-formamidopyrimidine glycosylase family protein [Pyrinomonadaceae bacterium]